MMVQWALSKANPGFASTTSGPDSQYFNLQGISTATFNQIATLEYTNIATSGSETIDVTSLTNNVGESFSFGHVLGILVLPVGSKFTFGPGASNPLQWFFGGSTQSVVLQPGDAYFYSSAATATGSAVSGSVKTLTFTNSGSSATNTLTVVIWGSTT